jgi:hypothetical protein
MAQAKTSYHDFNHTNDGTMKVTETLEVTGVTTLTGGLAGNTLKVASGPSGTTAGATWTSGAPALTAAQMFIKCTAGSTTYRIPVFLDA